MVDLTLTFGGDLALSATGDLGLASDVALTEQRVLRRMLTNPGDYIWQLPYGGGLASYVGVAGMSARIAADARAQLKLEARVAQSPTPKISASENPSSGVVLSILYADAVNGQNQILTVPT